MCSLHCAYAAQHWRAQAMNCSVCAPVEHLHVVPTARAQLPYTPMSPASLSGPQHAWLASMLHGVLLSLCCSCWLVCVCRSALRWRHSICWTLRGAARATAYRQQLSALQQQSGTATSEQADMQCWQSAYVDTMVAFAVIAVVASAGRDSVTCGYAHQKCSANAVQYCCA